MWAGRAAHAVRVGHHGADVELEVRQLLDRLGRHAVREVLFQLFGVLAARPEGGHGRAVAENREGVLFFQLPDALGDDDERQLILARLGQDRREVSDEVLGLLHVQDVRDAFGFRHVLARERRELLFRYYERPEQVGIVLADRAPSPTDPRYSQRNALTGSTRTARRAGM